MKQTKPQKEVASAMLKRFVVIFCLMCMFGLFWLLGAASVYQAAVFFEWPFIVLSVAQGTILFVYIVLIDARKEWQNILTCNDRKKTHLYSASGATKQSKVSSLSKTSTAKPACFVYANTMENTSPVRHNTISEESFEKVGDIAITFLSDSEAVEGTPTSFPLTVLEDNSNGITMNKSMY